jgi:hypothetical protein
MRIHSSNKGLGFKPSDASIFLAGPTLRESHQHLRSWRLDAVDLFQSMKFTGSLFLPEPFAKVYNTQVEWEEKYLNLATVILFWIPRDLTTLPGFTTNVEFGEWMKSGKVGLGYPPEAKKMRYLESKARKYGIPIAQSLEETIILAILKAKEIK